MIEASQIAPGIYQGSRPPEGGALRRAGVRTLVLCAREIQDGEYPGVHVVHCPLDDAELTSDEWRRAWRAAGEALARLPHGPLLVTCAHGRNRSGLVTAIVLRLLYGVPGDECVAVIRERRWSPWGGALTNESFVRAIRTLR